MLQEAIRKKALRPAQLRSLIAFMVSEYRVSVRRACRMVALARSTCRYQPVEDSNVALRACLQEIAMVRVRYGFWRVYTLLRHEGWAVNHKRVYRLYKEEGLNLRSKRPRRSRAGAHRLPRVDVGRLISVNHFSLAH